ncbi:MAG: hypothetical protein EBZ49_13720, partial [Proteobacteria bacterium]|nr:hypothetical protein [Pseudomonadota bacterium]
QIDSPQCPQFGEAFPKLLGKLLGTRASLRFAVAKIGSNGVLQDGIGKGVSSPVIGQGSSKA